MKRYKVTMDNKYIGNFTLLSIALEYTAYLDPLTFNRIADLKLMREIIIDELTIQRIADA